VQGWEEQLWSDCKYSTVAMDRAARSSTAVALVAAAAAAAAERCPWEEKFTAGGQLLST
jgi:hypothetical protein